MTEYHNIVDHINTYPLLIKIAWALSVILLLAIIVLTFYLKIVRSILRKKDKEVAKFQKAYEETLITYLYATDDGNTINDTQKTIISQLKKSVNNRAKRKIIISALYNLMNQVSGEMSDAIKVLYYKTGLINFTLAKLSSKEWYKIARGIGDLTRFNIEEVHDKIEPFINHPKKEVNNAAKLYLVNVHRFKGLTFLDDLKTPLSEWTQVQLLETLQKFDDQQICDIKPWLCSKNDSVVLFALKLAQIYNQFEVKDTLIELLSHTSKKIRVFTIDVLTHLYGIEAKEMLKTNFNEISLEEQISFFGLLEKLVMPDDEPFVEKHLFHKNFEIQLLALKILKSINLNKYMGISKSHRNQSNAAIIEYVNKI